MSEIITPTIPDGIYPTKDTIITLTVDTNKIFAATSQEDVTASVDFDDNRGDGESNDGPDYQHSVIQNNFVTWIGAVKDLDGNPADQVLIYQINQSNPPPVIIPNPSNGYGRTHVDGRAVNRTISSYSDYSVVLWVYHGGVGKAFQIDPKLKVDPSN